MDIIGLVTEMQSLETELHHYLDQIHDYDQDGSLPKAYVAPKPLKDYSGMTIMDLVKIILVNRPYVSRYKDRPEKREEVNRRAAELEQVTAILESLGTLEEMTHG